MSARALVDAVEAVFPPTTAAEFDGEAPPGSPLPRVVRNHRVPAIATRSEANTPQARVGRLLITVAGGTERSVITILDQLMPPLEGARLVAAGWDLSPLAQIGEVRIYPDPDVLLPSGAGLHVQVGTVTFEYTATRTA